LPAASPPPSSALQPADPPKAHSAIQEANAVCFALFAFIIASQLSMVLPAKLENNQKK
jgi:hypothetical protein